MLTVTKGTFNGSVVIRDGKIAEAGEKVTVPAGAEIVDADRPVCHARHHRLPFAYRRRSINEGAVSVSSMVGIEDVINPEDISIYRALAGGVTTANILHGSANSIGGKCYCHEDALGQRRAGPDLRRRQAGHQVRSGRKSQACWQSPDGASIATPGLRYPATRMGVEDVIREAFTEAKAYQKAWKDYHAKVDRR